MTGGARGIGARIAACMAEHGSSVYVADISADAARACAATLRPDARGVAMDVTDRKQVDATIAEIVRDKGGVDILVNNAGIVSFGAFDAVSNDEWERMIAVNVTARRMERARHLLGCRVESDFAGPGFCCRVREKVDACKLAFA